MQTVAYGVPTLQIYTVVPKSEKMRNSQDIETQIYLRARAGFFFVGGGGEVLHLWFQLIKNRKFHYYHTRKSVSCNFITVLEDGLKKAVRCRSNTAFNT